MKKVAFECSECEASGSVVHDLVEDAYKVSVCPFCGEELDEVDDDLGEDNEEDE